MSHDEGAPRRAPWLWSGAIAIAIALGVFIRLQDPLSTPVIPAEDPYTHMALVQEHLIDGSLDPLHDGGSLYPPGMHAVVAAVWSFTGLDIYGLFRFGPVLLGGIGILGVGLLLLRFAGPLASVVGAFATALVPELAFRTTMMAPTALDLALLPFLLYALLEVVQGRLAWTAVAAPLAALLAIAHPWVYGVVSLAGALFLVFAVVFGWPTDRARGPTPRGLMAAGTIVAFALAVSMDGCWGHCGPGFTTVVGGELGALLPAASIIVLALATASTALLVLSPKRIDEAAKRVPAGLSMPREPTSTTIAILLATATIPAALQGFPRFVGVQMFGWPLLVAAGIGLVGLPYFRGPIPMLGAALFVTTFPFAIYNPFSSPFWPHRVAVYLGLALVLLAAVAIARLARQAQRALSTERASEALFARPLAAAIPILLVAASLGGLWAGTPDASERSWYRLYDECEFEGIHAVAEEANEQPSTVVITGDWRPKLVLAALAADASRIWYHDQFYTMGTEERQGLLDGLADQNRSAIAVVDPHLSQDHPETNTTFLQEDDWTEVVDQSCGSQDSRVVAYQYDKVEQ